jgi:aspartyl-tRNA(Asn)/glutamyl-tRNA(Gln) amidotransferase subunit A
MSFATFQDLQADLQAGRVTCRQIVAQYLDRIDSSTALNAFLEVYRDEALAAADAVDQKRSAGTAGRLAGMVLGVKDVICHKGHALTASSKLLAGFESRFTATALQRLLDQDAIVIGRLNCDEFAMGSSNENSAYGPVRNPLETNKVPGGSSGGSAAAVAAGLCTVSLGSDTGGSIRQPASFCGLVGLKPTYGRISRYGLIAYASSFDQISPIGLSAFDVALVAELMAGVDPMDNTSADVSVTDFGQQLQKPLGALRIGLMKEAVDTEGLDPEIRAAVVDLETRLQAQGHLVDRVSFPLLQYLVPTYYILTTAEASSNLSRFDGIRYGYRSATAQNLEDVYVLSRSEGFGPEVQRRIMLGTFVLSSGYYDAYYTRAQQVRRLIRNQTRSLLSEYDILLSPTTPTTAFGIGEKVEDPIQMYLSDIYTVHANLAGNPAVSFPLGTHSNGLPFGIHALGRDFDEGLLLQFANQVA